MEAASGWRAFVNVKTVVVGVAAAVAVTLVVGVPTAVIPNELFRRMTPTRPQDYVFLGLTALLTGLLAATYTVPIPGREATPGRLTSAGLLSFLAVGCPICNKVIVLLLGVSGAFTYWEPLQPVLGAASLLLLSVSLWLRLRQFRLECAACTAS